MKRRHFIQTSGLAFSGFVMPLGLPNFSLFEESGNYKSLIRTLLKEWCEGMLAHQINSPNDDKTRGGLMCPSCGVIHGRCMDAVLPFLYMADVAGDKKYLKAGIDVFEWSKNVSADDGSWTVMPDPKTWKGISVFGAIALAEALKFHGHILPKEVKERWTERLGRAGDFIFKTFDLTFTNINYGFTAVYALLLLGDVLKKKEYTEKSHALAAEIKNWFTEPHKLIFGEGKPSTKRSAKGLLPVDLGYNVEETLNSAVMYAVEENDKYLLELIQKALEGHLEFMLPDGAWDNSWGTRQYKWSYWGSRTTDGCHAAYTMMAHLNPVFGRAVYQNTLLLKQCTHEGLLHGGTHFVSHGVKPCIHHTFSHAKALVVLLNEKRNLDLIKPKAVLPREKDYGTKYFPEIDVWLVSKNGWKATVSTYDFIYTERSQQATGGALGVLFHERVGILCTASMAKYRPVEIFNQQTLPDNEEFALTPRLEMFLNGVWYTNLYDLKATVKKEEKAGNIELTADVQLLNEDYQAPTTEGVKYQLRYLFTRDSMRISAINKSEKTLSTPVSWVLPIVSPAYEKVTQLTTHSIKIEKKDGAVIVEANAPLSLKNAPNDRVFNLVPGMEAVPIMVNFDTEKENEIICTIRIA
jgi:hypothetical protein